MSLVFESMPIASLSSPVSSPSLSSTAQPLGTIPSVTSSAPAPVSSVSNNSLVTAYLATETVTATSSSSSSKYYNSSSAPTTDGKTSTISSSKPATGMIVSTADFTSGQSLPTSLVLATGYSNSTAQGAVPTSTYTSWEVVGGSGNGSNSAVGVGGTALASPQDRPSSADRAAVRTKSSSLALGVLVLVLVLIG